MKLLIRNLARTTTEAELESIFNEHGSVESCSLVLDNETGKSKGFAFIEMPDESEANTAITALNGTKVSGDKIRVKAADE